MKKTYSISLEEDLMDKFTQLSVRLWTNKTNFLSMIITDVVKSEKITFCWYNNESDFEIVKDEKIVDLFNSVNGWESSSIICW